VKVESFTSVWFLFDEECRFNLKEALNLTRASGRTFYQIASYDGKPVHVAEHGTRARSRT